MCLAFFPVVYHLFLGWLFDCPTRLWADGGRMPASHCCTSERLGGGRGGGGGAGAVSTVFGSVDSF